ncbi:D-ornithine 4,5-aminomutase subunit alpha [Fervidicola ferrireducens]|uniref:D-ornithine 4,5-aminomutase subunit alpha n=1 Tax=Fervidicola ferrireducens TaxID=520764 RepID=A0A140LDS0_9FIRM|nr:ornithine aminomutase subunit alpha [Fervidicola ferrireducens]KXG78695.1 D-ornithine 4,5-aminomutase subunit alpha [Fervidicola ferrireducens]
MQRKDDFEERRKHLANLTEEELEKRFWELTEKIVDPLIELARTHTSPSIERSVLLRMGFDSLTAKAVVERCVEKGLLGKGAGHVVLKYALYKGISVKEAGNQLARGEGWDEIEKAMALKIDASIVGKVM